MELKETIDLMNSSDHKDRFKAEYYQLKIRSTKLSEMLDKWEMGELTFKPTCPMSTYVLQLRAMTEYLAILELRAIAEKVEL